MKFPKKAKTIQTEKSISGCLVGGGGGQPEDLVPGLILWDNRIVLKQQQNVRNHTKVQRNMFFLTVTNQQLLTPFPHV